MSSDRVGVRHANAIAKRTVVGIVLLGVSVGAYFFWPETTSTQLASHGSTGEACSLNEETQQNIRTASTGDMAAFAAMDKPYSLADFKFDDKDGQPKSIADWSGRTVLVNIWATWCAPCRAEMPALDELQGKLGGPGFEVLPISIDRGGPAKPKGFFEEISIKQMGFYHDAEAMTLNALKREGLALGLPVTLLVDGRGCAIGRLNGPAEWADDAAQNLIKAVF